MINVHDDLLIHGSTQELHDKALHDTLQRLEDLGLTLNKSKCLINVDKIDFFGYTFSESGVELQKRKIHAITKADAPRNARELK